MTPFQPPPDYTRREVEATEPACPFYGCSLVHGGSVMLRSSGNQCALVTSAYSPCWMEVGESRAPDWEQCPRNPEFEGRILDQVEYDRGSAHALYMERLIQIRDDFPAASSAAKQEKPL